MWYESLLYDSDMHINWSFRHTFHEINSVYQCDSSPIFYIFFGWGGGGGMGLPIFWNIPCILNKIGIFQSIQDCYTLVWKSLVGYWIGSIDMVISSCE